MSLQYIAYVFPGRKFVTLRMKTNWLSPLAGSYSNQANASYFRMGPRAVKRVLSSCYTFPVLNEISWTCTSLLAPRCIQYVRSKHSLSRFRGYSSYLTIMAKAHLWKDVYHSDVVYNLSKSQCKIARKSFEKMMTEISWCLAQAATNVAEKKAIRGAFTWHKWAWG